MQRRARAPVPEPLSRRALLGGLLGLAACAHGAGEQLPRPALRLQDVDGNPFPWESLQGQVVWVQFVASWCFPCLGAVRLAEQLQQKHPQGFRALLVGMDREGARVLQPWRAQLATSLTMLVADSDLLEGRTALGTVKELPLALLLDREGVLRDGLTGNASFEQVEPAVARWL